MRRRVCELGIRLATVLAAGLFAAAGASPPPGSQPQTVSLYVTVEDGDRLVTGLTDRNLRVYENGRPRAFRLEEPEKPMLVTLLVEHSQLSWVYLDDIDRAVREFVNHAPEGHWYSLATFSHGLTVQVDFTKQKGNLLATWSQLGQPSWSEVDTYDAVWEVLDKLSLLRGRRVLVLIGSGFDTLSARTLDEVRKKIESTDTVVYAIAAGSLLRGQYDPYLGSAARLDLYRADGFLKMLADKSGGQAFFPRFETAYSDVAKSVLSILAHQYRVVYQPDPSAGEKYRKIKVEAFTIADDKRRDYSVRAREGWRREGS
jgi:VWFA-related protein